MMQNMEAKTAPMDTAELTARIDKLHYTIHHSEDFGSANSIIWQVEVGQQIEALIGRWRLDLARIDKIERMAKAVAAKSGQVPYFLVLNDGEIVITNCMEQDGETVPQPNFRTVREAIDAEPEPK